MLGFKNSQTQALQRFLVIANIDLLLEGPLHRFHDRAINFN